MGATLSHASLMDGVYAYQRHIYDFTRKYYLLGRDRAVEELSPSIDHNTLEVGCGTARNLIIAAKKYPDRQFYGIDISAQMLTTAEANIKKAGLEHQITLGKADAGNFDAEHLFGIGKFDRILMSYTLSMIPPWQEALRQALSILSEDGKLVFVDFWDQAELPPWSKTILKHWLDLFHVAPRETLKTTAKKLAIKHGRQLNFKPLYKGYACIGSIA